MNSLVSVNPRHMTGLMYVQKFGQLPEGLGRWVATTGQTQKLDNMMKKALEDNRPIQNWDSFYPPLR
jgi:hypothetical protein